MNSNKLKIFAMMFMLIDHIGAIFIIGYPGYIYFRIIGRLAFPIYVFLLIEGFLHTSNIKKYIFRMAVFSIVSEIPFDLAFYNKTFEIYHQNVFFTLTLGLIMIYLIEEIINKMNIMYNNYQGVIIGTIFVFIFGVISELIQCDYGFVGIIIIYIMYILRYEKRLIQMLGILAAFIIITDGIEKYAALSVIPLYFYNGKHGHKSIAIKYSFYFFYPCHLLILALIKQLFWII